MVFIKNKAKKYVQISRKVYTIRMNLFIQINKLLKILYFLKCVL